MRFLFYYFLFRLLGNPFLAIIVIAFIYLIVDRQFIGLIPDFFKPLRRKSQIKNLQEEINLNPANVNAYKELGLLYLEEKKYKLASQYLLDTLDKLGEYADTHFYLGKAYYLGGQKEEGKKELEKAIEINSKVGYGEPYVYLLDAEINDTQNTEKIKDLINNLQHFGTTEILYKAGMVLKTFEKERANKMFNEALETYRMSPKHFKKVHRRWALLAKLNLLIK